MSLCATARSSSSRTFRLPLPPAAVTASPAPTAPASPPFMKVLTGEIDAQKGNVVRPKDRRPQAGPVRVRRVPRHRHRHHGQQALCGPRSKNVTRIYEKPEMTDEDGFRLGRARGHRRRRGRLRSRERTPPILLQGLDIPDEVHERKMSELQGGQKVRVLLAQALLRQPRRPCCSTSRRTTSTSTRSTGSRTSSSATTAP